MAPKPTDNARDFSEPSHGYSAQPSDDFRREPPMSGAWSQGSQGYAGHQDWGRTSAPSYYRAALDRMGRHRGQGGEGWAWSHGRQGRERFGGGRLRHDFERPAEGRVYSGVGGAIGGGFHEPREDDWRRRDEARGHVERDLSFGGETRGGRWEREPLTAGEVMTRNVKALRREHTLRDAAQIMRDESCGIVPVVDENMRLLGVLTDRDIVMRGYKEERPFSQIRVAELMTDDVECVTAEEPLTDVIELMGSKQVRRVPVVDRHDRLIGIISMGDVANRADDDETLQRAFERVSSKRSFWSRLFS